MVQPKWTNTKISKHTTMTSIPLMPFRKSTTRPCYC